MGTAPGMWIEWACNCPVTALTAPIPISSTMLATKKYVGTAKTLPASRTPRRLAKAITSTRKIAMAVVPGARPGKTEVRAATPAATETATVSV